MDTKIKELSEKYNEELNKWLEVPIGNEHSKGFNKAFKIAKERFNKIAEEL